MADRSRRSRRSPMPATARFPAALRLALQVVLALLLPCLSLLSLLATGCDGDPPLSLLTLRDVAPRDVEVGERIEISGAGFPRGRSARVVMRGVLHRAGRVPFTGFEARAEAVVVSENAIELVYDARLQSLLCGPGDTAVHTTFRGQVTVAFAAAVPGAPPASATLPGVVLDLRPPPGGATAIALMRAEGDRFLETSGIVIERAASAGSGATGLLVENVRADSAADRAGMLAGDLLVSFDGVHVRSPADAVPPSAARRANVGVRRGGDPTERVLTLPVAGYRARTSVAPIALVTLLAALVGFWLFAPVPRTLRWMARRVPFGIASHGGAWTYVPLIAIPITVATPLALRELAGIEPDLVSIALATLAASLVLHGLTAEGGVGASIRAALAGSLPLVPAAVAVGAAGLFTGAARMTEASQVQGAWPWEFVALRGFASLAVFVVAASALAMPERELPSFGRGGRIARAGRHAFVFVMASLLTVVFLGGWQSPFAEGSIATFVGAVLFIGKAAGVGAVVSSFRAALRSPSLSLTKRVLASIGAAMGVIGFAMVSGWETRATMFGDTQLVAWGLSAACAVVVLRMTWLIIEAARTPWPRLDPFA